MFVCVHSLAHIVDIYMYISRCAFLFSYMHILMIIFCWYIYVCACLLRASMCILYMYVYRFLLPALEGIESFSRQFNIQYNKYIFTL